MISKYLILDKREFFSFLTFILILLGVGTNPDFLEYKYYKSFTHHSIKTQFAIVVAYIQFVIFFFLIYVNLKKNRFKNINFFFKIFLLLNFFQLFALLVSRNNNYNLLYNIESINLILFINYLREKIFLLKKIFYFFLFLIFIFFLIIYLASCFVLIFEGNIFYMQYGNLHKYFWFLLDVPRSSGIARLALILFITSLFFRSTNIIANLLRVYLFIPAIFLTQSRLVLFLFFLLIFIILFQKYLKLNFYKIKITKLIKNFLIYPILVTLFISMLNVKNLNYLKTSYKSFTTDDTFVSNQINKNEKIIFFRPNHLTFSSGRFEDWKKLIELSKSRLLIGYGTQADRFFIQQTASSAIIYILITSGILGLLCIFLIYYKIIIIAFKYYNKVKKKMVQNKEKEVSMSFLFLFTLLLRSIFETSYAVFGIDFVLFILCLNQVYNVGRKKN